MLSTGVLCKVCDSENTEFDIKAHGRQRFKCLACKALFFTDEETPLLVTKIKTEETPIAKVKTRDIQIIDAYKRGDKVWDIYLTFGIRNSDLYPLLRKAGVLLRSDDPNNPASSMWTRHQARIATAEKHDDQKKEVEPMQGKINAANLSPETRKEPGIPAPPKPKKRKQVQEYWDKNKEDILTDYNSMKILIFLKKWSIATGTWIRLKKLWGVQDKIYRSRTGRD